MTVKSNHLSACQRLVAWAETCRVQRYCKASCEWCENGENLIGHDTVKYTYIEKQIYNRIEEPRATRLGTQPADYQF